MNLKEYLKTKGITHAAFGRQIEVSRNYISMLSRGFCRPSIHLARAIQDATNGLVTVEILRSAPTRNSPSKSGEWLNLDTNTPPDGEIVLVKGPEVSPQRCYCFWKVNSLAFCPVGQYGIKKLESIAGVTHWKSIDK